MSIDMGSAPKTDEATAAVAEEIRALLARRRMSGRELARRLDVSPAWVSYRLSGIQEIGVNDLARIAEILKVRMVDLLPHAEREPMVTPRYPEDGVRARVKIPSVASLIPRQRTQLPVSTYRDPLPNVMTHLSPSARDVRRTSPTGVL